MTSIYGGDEVNALVIDTGSYQCRAGYAGDEVPKAIFPSAVGALPLAGSSGATPMDQDGAPAPGSRKFSVGSQAMALRADHKEVISPFGDDGIICDWEAMEALWAHIFGDRLRCEASEFAMMIAEPSHNTPKAREKAVELMFERFGAPALFLAKNAVLSSFATGRQTSLVVDAGHQATTVCAVHDGYVLNKSLCRSPLGGQLLTRCALQAAEAAAEGPILPRYAFKRVEKSTGKFEIQKLDTGATTESYRRYCVDAIGSDLKESLFRVSEQAFHEDPAAPVPPVSYELPDGSSIQIGGDRFRVPELMFQPQLIAAYPGADDWVSRVGGATPLSLPAAIVDAVNKCDADARRELYSGVVLMGGTSLLSGLRERTERTLAEVAPQAFAGKVKVIAPANPTERRFSTWIGGSILASLGSFHQMWMSKAEYSEHGASLIHRKAP